MPLPPELPAKSHKKLPLTAIWYWGVNGVGFLIATVGTGVALIPNFSSTSTPTQQQTINGVQPAPSPEKPTLMGKDPFKINLLPSTAPEKAYNLRIIPLSTQTPTKPNNPFHSLVLDKEINSLLDGKPTTADVKKTGEESAFLEPENSLDWGKLDLSILKLGNTNHNLELQPKNRINKTNLTNTPSSTSPQKNSPKYPAIFPQISRKYSPKHQKQTTKNLPISLTITEAVYLGNLSDKQQKNTYLSQHLHRSNQEKSAANHPPTPKIDWIQRFTSELQREIEKINRQNLVQRLKLSTPQETTQPSLPPQNPKTQQIITAYYQALAAQTKVAIARLELANLHQFSLHPDTSSIEKNRYQQALANSRLNLLTAENKYQKYSLVLQRHLDINRKIRVETSNSLIPLQFEIADLTQVAIKNNQDTSLTPNQISTEIHTKLQKINHAYSQIQAQQKQYQNLVTRTQEISKNKQLPSFLQTNQELTKIQQQKLAAKLNYLNGYKELDLLLGHLYSWQIPSN